MFSSSKTAAPVSGSFQVSNSLRFRSSASAYLNRTPSVAGNQRTWTWSGWVKRGTLGSSIGHSLLDGGSAGPLCTLDFYGDQLRLYVTDNGVTTSEVPTTNAVFRDPSAWYHCVCAVDTTQATTANRVKFYVNGVLQTITGLTGTLITQNANLSINRAAANYIGIFSYASNRYFDGYMAEVNFIDGQALTPSSFGSINATTGVWQPARYTGSYGTNGFYLKFNNGNSTTTLGNDSSGNNNNWTTNNFSLTAGSTYDSMLDVPTNWVAGDPVQARGNYAVLNPVDTYSASPTFSNANLTISTPTFGTGTARSTISVSSGQWYWEVTVTSNSSGDPMIGILGTTATLTGVYTSASGYAYQADFGQKWNNGSAASYGASYTVNDVIGVALNLNSGTLTFYKNGVSQGTAFTGLAGSFCAAASDSSGSGSSVIAFNFGQRPFAYTPPSGFKSLCTQNLPAPAIYNGANHMAATTYTGNGATQSISNAVNSVSFQPDFVWVKERSSTAWHVLCDSVRGANNALYSNSTIAEESLTNTFQSFNGNGFTVAYNSSYSSVFANRSGQTYVGWQWKAGGTAVTNTSGSITSQVSANPTAGFSVVTYTGTGANATVGHGLGVAPSFIIFKKRNNAVNWGIYHTSIGNQYIMQFEAAAAYGPSSSYFNSTSPSSTVISVGTLGNVNDSGATYVAYCFAAIAGYSAFGSYTGNGSADGPFVWTGFLPRFVLIKITSASTDGWILQDTTRFPYNVITQILAPNSSGAESTFGTSFNIDMLSNGFKIRNSGSWQNASGATYIYAAFASNPFQNSLAF